VSGFSADWLALREPFDAAARSAAIVAKLRAHLAQAANVAPLAVVDLGAGAGSNLRYLAPLLGGEQRWRLVDHDANLLEAALASTEAWAQSRGIEVRRAGSGLTLRSGDFACDVRGEITDLDSLAAIELPIGGLVTAAALLDLVSQRWLDALAQACRAARAAVCFALTYDGRTTVEPIEPLDARVLAFFNRHQRGDKGFGPALGPDAPVAAEMAFAANGYEACATRSDWVIGAEHPAMQTALLDGWLGAACELAPEWRAPLTDWHERRCAQVAAGRSTLSVGHVDLVGWL
jgi:hypothetical protein